MKENKIINSNLYIYILFLAQEIPKKNNNNKKKKRTMSSLEPLLLGEEW